MSEIIIYSRFNRPVSKFSPSSSGFAPVYQEKINKDGRRSLVLVGKHNINEFVQSSLDSTLVYNILDRFQLGDTSVLEKVRGFYADVTSVPSSLLEAYNFLTGISKKFDTLPAEMKAKFGNSVEGFVASIENGDIKNIIAAMSSDNDNIKVEVKSDVEES